MRGRCGGDAISSAASLAPTGGCGAPTRRCEPADEAPEVVEETCGVASPSLLPFFSLSSAPSAAPPPLPPLPFFFSSSSEPSPPSEPSESALSPVSKSPLMSSSSAWWTKALCGRLAAPSIDSIDGSVGSCSRLGRSFELDVSGGAPRPVCVARARAAQGAQRRT